MTESEPNIVGYYKKRRHWSDRFDTNMSGIQCSLGLNDNFAAHNLIFPPAQDDNTASERRTLEKFAHPARIAGAEANDPQLCRCHRSRARGGGSKRLNVKERLKVPSNANSTVFVDCASSPCISRSLCVCPHTFPIPSTSFGHFSVNQLEHFFASSLFFFPFFLPPSLLPHTRVCSKSQVGSSESLSFFQIVDSRGSARLETRRRPL